MAIRNVDDLIKKVKSDIVKKFNEETWILSLIIAAITLILGILIIVNPFESYIVLAVYVGVMVCVYAAMDIVQQILFRKRVKEIVKIFFE